MPEVIVHLKSVRVIVSEELVGDYFRGTAAACEEMGARALEAVTKHAKLYGDEAIIEDVEDEE